LGKGRSGTLQRRDWRFKNTDAWDLRGLARAFRGKGDPKSFWSKGKKGGKTEGLLRSWRCQLKAANISLEHRVSAKPEKVAKERV